MGRSSLIAIQPSHATNGGDRTLSSARWRPGSDRRRVRDESVERRWEGRGGRARARQSLGFVSDGDARPTIGREPIRQAAPRRTATAMPGVAVALGPADGRTRSDAARYRMDRPSPRRAGARRPAARRYRRCPSLGVPGRDATSRARREHPSARGAVASSSSTATIASRTERRHPRGPRRWPRLLAPHAVPEARFIQEMRRDGPRPAVQERTGPVAIGGLVESLKEPPRSPSRNREESGIPERLHRRLELPRPPPSPHAGNGLGRGVRSREVESLQGTGTSSGLPRGPRRAKVLELVEPLDELPGRSLSVTPTLFQGSRSHAPAPANPAEALGSWTTSSKAASTCVGSGVAGRIVTSRARSSRKLPGFCTRWAAIPEDTSARS